MKHRLYEPEGKYAVLNSERVIGHITKKPWVNGMPKGSVKGQLREVKPKECEDKHKNVQVLECTRWPQW